MKREFYKLTLVAIMIVFAFSIGFFLGREVTLAGPNRAQSKHTDQKTPSFVFPEDKTKTSKSKRPKSLSAQNQKERVQKYKNAWPKKQNKVVQGKAEPAMEKQEAQSLDPPPPAKEQTAKEQTAKEQTAKEQVEEVSDKTYGLILKKQKTQRLAIQQSAELKVRFPQWRFFSKKVKDGYIVYIGPFELKSSAEKFLKKIKKHPELSSARVSAL